MAKPKLIDFSPFEEKMIKRALKDLKKTGYHVGVFKELIRAELPAQYRAMTLEDGAAIGEAAFASHAMLDHVLEEELLHLEQKASGKAKVFGPGTAKALENEVDEKRKFPFPG
jgi:hypothetical protein